MASLFPTAVRQSGCALPYNVSSALFAGPALLALAWLLRDYGLMSPMYVVLLACGLAIVSAILTARVSRFLGRAAVSGELGASAMPRLGSA